jgi:tetratricopeptide (TPR) repeat protein
MSEYPRGEPPSRHDQDGCVTLRGALGVQAGHGNLQQNYFAPVTQIQSVPVPVALHQLPPRIPGFTGRDSELTELTGMLTAANAAPVVISAVSGLAGVGKTALAVHAAHAVVDAGLFPGGVLFVDLHGYDDNPAAADQVLDSLLRALGVTGGQIPSDLGARSALFRSLLAKSDNPVLVIADNASAAEQVLPLLPGDDRHRVLVTSRHTLRLHARVREVNVLNARTSVELLDMALRTANASDGRATKEAASAARVAALCGYLPLALQIAAALLISDPCKTFTELAGELAEEEQRLASLDDGERAVRTAFDLSYRRLPPAAARLFRLLAINPGPDLTTGTAAVLAEETLPRTRQALAELLRAHMVQRAPGTGRWTMHDLLRDYSRSLLAKEPDGENSRLGRRLRHYYLQTAGTASRLVGIRHDLPQIGLAHGDDSITPLMPQFADRTDAMAWLEAERANLQATVVGAASAGDNASVTGIASAMAGFMRSAGYFQQAIVIHGVAVQATAAAHDLPGQANALTDLSAALQASGRLPETAETANAALRIYEELRDDSGQARALTELGDAQRLAGRYPSAIQTLKRALDLHKTLDDPQGRATALGSLGASQRLTGDLPAALISLSDALQVHVDFGDKPGQAKVLITLGAVQRETGDFAAASNTLTRALRLGRELTDRPVEGTALRHLGAVQWLTGNLNTALTTLSSALQIHTEMEDELGQAHVLTFLGAVQRQTGDFQLSGESLRRAIKIYQQIGDRGAEVEAVNHYAELLILTGNLSHGRELHLSALELAREIHSRWDEANILCGLAAADRAEGNFEGAQAYLGQALDRYQAMGCAADVARVRTELEHLNA